ncbi:FAD-binding protein [Candidatus Pacearchaeota archaeon]|nr:MAG: FAD-binding protein [Candidatus Pacearchaeota archaeon]
MKYDVIVIGAGSGGLNIASFMNKAGFKVLLVDKTDKNIGGDCLNFGCVPSKALIHAARIVHHSRLAREFGVRTLGNADIKKVKAYVKSKQEKIRVHENAEYFRSLGIDVELGEAEFAGKNSIVVNGKVCSAKKIVIATGSRPRQLSLPGIEKVKHIYTNETIFDIDFLPKRLVVIGGGPIGVELGQAFSRLGSEVSIVQRGPQFLPKEAPEIAEVLHNALAKEGVKIFLNCSPKRFEKNTLIADTPKGERKLQFDAVLVAIGRVLNIPRGLERAGIELTEDKRKIKVDPYLRTTNKNVYACGDVAGSYQFTHAAELHAKIILSNFFSPIKKKLSYDKFAWVTFTSPEIATFGLRERELQKKNKNYVKIVQDFGEIDRAITDGNQGRLVLFVSNNKILGGSLVAENAGEIAQELILAMSSELHVKKIFDKVYPYPTASRVNRKAVTQLFANKLTPFAKKVLRFLYNLG